MYPYSSGREDDQPWWSGPQDSPGQFAGLLDEIIAREVADRFIEDPAIGSGQVVVEVQNRVVILKGWIDSAAARAAAGRQAWATPGVYDVSNRLTTAG